MSHILSIETLRRYSSPISHDSPSRLIGHFVIFKNTFENKQDVSLFLESVFQLNFNYKTFNTVKVFFWKIFIFKFLRFFFSCEISFMEIKIKIMITKSFSSFSISALSMFRKFFLLTHS